MFTKVCMEAVFFTKHDNFNYTKLFYAWLQILKRDLHGNENLRRRGNMYLIVWDGNVNVISPRDDNLGEIMSTVYPCACEGEHVWVHVRRRGRRSRSPADPR